MGPEKQNRLTGPARLSSAVEDDPRTVAAIAMLRSLWFIRLRWIFLVGAVAVLALERFVAVGAQRPPALGVLLISLGAVNLVWTGLVRLHFRPVLASAAPTRGPLKQLIAFANAQVAVDLLLLTAILRYTGGVENPLAIFYLFHMAIVSLLLRHWQALLQGVWALVLYAVLVIGEWQQWFTPHYAFLADYPVGLYAHTDFVWAVLVVVTCGVFGTLYFTLHLAHELDEQKRELQRANAALRQSQQAVQDLQRRRSRFMQTAAHQLKSPLAVIQTLTELIRSRIVPPEAVPGTCDKIIRRCQDGIVQVGELLTLARVQEADPARHRQAEADVCAAVDELCNRFGPLAESKQIRLVCDLPKDSALTVCVDPRDLRDCLGNLIENALKYMDKPGEVTVTVTPKCSDSQLIAVAVTVTDRGMGIDPSLLRPASGEPGQEPIFDAFRRGVNVIAAGIPGTGLGLSIVREIVEQAGGRILVTSRPGRGTSFTVTFPVRAALGDQPQVRDTRASEVVLEAPQGDSAPPAPPDRV